MTYWQCTSYTMGCCPPVREDNPIALASGLKLVDYLPYRRPTSFSEWIIVCTGGQPMVYLFYTTYISVDLAQHGLFRAKVGTGGINNI